MIVGICKLDMKLEGHRSLKEKRQVVRKIKDSIFSKFKIPISEVEHNDLWQRTSLGFAIVGNSKPKIDAMASKILDLIFLMDIGFVLDKKFEYIYVD